MFSAKFFLKLGADVRDEYRKDVFEKGKDVHGKSFKPYSQEYSELKKANTFNKQGRELTTKDKPLPDSVLNFMSKELCKYIDKKYIKPNCKTTKHKIGK